MKKIVLIGKLDRTLEELYKALSRQYVVQICTQTEGVLQDVLRIVQPDMVVFHVLECDEKSKSVFDILHNFYLRLPRIILGAKETCDYYLEYLRLTNVYPMYRPVGVTAVVEQCNQILYGSSQVVKEVEKTEQSRAKILIVDDSAVTLRSVKSLLDGKYKVSVATSGEMALSLMQRMVPDLILLDYEMPGCDGKQTLEAIRQEERLQGIPVIFLTGVADKTRIASILELNPAGYLLKPTEKDKLLSVIEEKLK